MTKAPLAPSAVSILWALFAVLTTDPAFAQPQSDDAVLRQLKQEIWPRAYRENDVDLLDRILHERFVLIDASGETTPKRKELAMLPEYRWTHDEFAYGVDHLEIFDGRTAVVSGAGRATGTSESGRYCLTYRSSNVLVKQNGAWKAVLSHVSGVDTRCDRPDGTRETPDQ